MDLQTCGSDYLSGLTDVLQSGMTVAISSWGDAASSMEWLDSPPCSIFTSCSYGTGAISSLHVS